MLILKLMSACGQTLVTQIITLFFPRRSGMSLLQQHKSSLLVKRPALIPGVVMVSGGETANTALVRNGPRHRGVPRDGPGACAMLLGRRGPRGSVTALKGRPFVTEAP